jgi:hypothetical protein
MLLLKTSKAIYHLFELVEQQQDSRWTQCIALVEQKLREKTLLYSSHTYTRTLMQTYEYCNTSFQVSCCLSTDNFQYYLLDSLI